jgi:mRNA interferase YafQ
LKNYQKLSLTKNDKKIFYYVIEQLSEKVSLEAKFKDHKLSGDFNRCRECHVKNDLLLIYQVFEDELRLIDIGTHSQLFG